MPKKTTKTWKVTQKPMALGVGIQLHWLGLPEQASNPIHQAERARLCAALGISS
jgi:hypothetical protein